MANFEGLWIIGYGLAGGFGGISDYEVIEAEDESQAWDYAFEQACEEYELYVGTNGLRSMEEIMEEDEIEDEDEAEEVYKEERESWITYSAVPYSKEEEQRVKAYHYHNPYKDRTDN